MASLGINPDIDIRDLLELAVSDDWSIQFSPLMRGPGGAQGGTFIRRAAPWKGLQKRDGESFSEYQNRLGEVNEGVASGLGTARSMAMDAAADGIALIRKDGQIYPVPQTSANLVREAGSGEIVREGFSSASEAIQAAANMGAGRPEFPSVY